MGIAKKALTYGKGICDTIMNKYPPYRIGPNIGMFTYHHGVFLSGMEALYHLTGEKKYFNYIKAWVDSLVDENGQILPCDNEWCSLNTLDYRQAGILLFNLYEETKDLRYKKVIEYLTESLKDYPMTPEGIFWHFANSENEVWLDGLYMASPLMAMYAKTFDKSEFFDIAANQVIGMYNHMHIDNGLLRHGWDWTKKAKWADPVNGLSAEVWGRAFGWFMVATVNILDYLQKSHDKYNEIINILCKCTKAIIKFQSADGRWYQVVDKGSLEGNWLENSCSTMFVYTLAKAVRKKYISDEYLKYAVKGFEGIINSMRVENGEYILTDICSGTCIESGTYEHYINRPIIENDLHGGIFTSMCCEIYKNFQNEE